MDLSRTRQLVRAYIDGGGTELGALLERLRPRLVLWCASRMSAALRAKLEPEDAAQEILLTAYRSIGDFRGKEENSFFAWLFRLAENRIRGLATYFAAAKRQDVEPHAFSQTSPSSAAARTEREGIMLSAIDGLRDDYRLVIRLRCIEGREVRDVAQAMDRTANAVRVLYCRALAALRKALGAMALAMSGLGSEGA